MNLLAIAYIHFNKLGWHHSSIAVLMLSQSIAEILFIKKLFYFQDGYYILWM